MTADNPPAHASEADAAAISSGNAPCFQPRGHPTGEAVELVNRARHRVMLGNSGAVLDFVFDGQKPLEIVQASVRQVA